MHSCDMRSNLMPVTLQALYKFSLTRPGLTWTTVSPPCMTTGEREEENVGRVFHFCLCFLAMPYLTSQTNRPSHTMCHNWQSPWELPACIPYIPSLLFPYIPVWNSDWKRCWSNKFVQPRKHIMKCLQKLDVAWRVADNTRVNELNRGCGRLDHDWERLWGR